MSVADVTKVVTIQAQHGPALQAAQAVDQATITKLVLNPKDTAAATTAVGEIVGKLHITPAAAVARLQDLGTIAPADLQTVQTAGPKVATAAAQLTALGKNISKSDAALLNQAQKASAASPKQWRNYFWIAVGGEVVFIPLIFLLTGFWSPGRARREEQEHEARVERELAALNA